MDSNISATIILTHFFDYSKKIIPKTEFCCGLSVTTEWYLATIYVARISFESGIQRPGSTIMPYFLRAFPKFMFYSLCLDFLFS